MQNILIIKLGALGDIILTLKTIAYIKETYPKANVTVLTRKKYAQWLQQAPFINTVIQDISPNPLNIFKLKKLKRKIKNFPIIFDLQQSKRSKLYITDSNAEILSFPKIPNDFSIETEWLANDDISQLNVQKPYVLIMPGGSSSKKEKQWPPQHYAEIAKSIAKNGYQPVIIGSKLEDKIAKTIIKHCPSSLNLCQQTNVSQIARLAKYASAAIGNDTGPLHIAAFMQCQTILLISNQITKNMYSPKYNKHIKVIESQNLQDLSPNEVETYLPLR